MTKDSIQEKATWSGATEECTLAQYVDLVASIKKETKFEDKASELKPVFELFDKFDQANTGTVPASVALHILSSIGEPISKEEGKVLLSESGFNMSDQLSFDQFVALLTPKS